MAYSTVTLTGKIKRGTSPAVGRATLTPTVNSVSDLDGNEVLYGPLIGTLDVNDGSFTIIAPATDDPNLRPQNFGYTLEFDLDEGTLPSIPEFSLPAAQVTIDITDIIPDPADPTFVPTLTGPANTLAVGTVTTGAAGTAAEVVITGTSPNQTISFVIPQGLKGDKGDKGDANTLTVGTVDVNTDGTADVAITGLAPNQTISFGIPQGPQGIQGIQGVPGEVSTQQLNDGLATKVDEENGMAYRTLLAGYKEIPLAQFVAHDGAFTIYFGGANSESANVFECNLTSGSGQSVFVIWDKDTNYGSAYTYSATLIFKDTCAVVWPVGTRFADGAAPPIEGETWVNVVMHGDVATVGLAWAGIV